MSNLHDKITEIFSPTFFLATQKETKYLTHKSVYLRKACNASHPLSQFIINSARQLQRRVPGLFFEMLRSLAEDDAQTIITVINDLLKRLKNLPDIGIVVPSDLQLTKDDFVGF